MTSLMNPESPEALKSALLSLNCTDLLRLKAHCSPGGFASVASRGKWTTAKHLEHLDQCLVDVASCKLRRLMVTMPPRHGKSFLVSQYFPAWFLCMNPEKRVLLTAYEANFAANWGRKVRDAVEEMGPVHFGVELRRDSKAANRWGFHGYSGGMETAGVGGALTGKGADLLIIDDPVKNAEEANSEVIREKMWEWYTSTAYTRVEPGGAVVLIQTRWHEDDLAGRVLQQAKVSGEDWAVCDLPAIAGANDPLGRCEGEALWPQRYPLDRLDEIRRAIPPYWWEALYQQRPTSAEGGMFRKSWFRYWKGNETYQLGARFVPKSHCRAFATMDLAFAVKKDSDFTVIAAWAATPEGDLVLLDLLRERMDAPSLIPAAKSIYDRFDCQYIGIESVLGQSLVVHGARQEGLAVKSLLADTDKITRSIPAQIRMQAGQVWFPTNAPWLADFEHELLSFPRGTHDDCVDVLSYAAAEVQRFGSGPGESEDEKESRLKKERNNFEALLLGKQ